MTTASQTKCTTSYTCTGCGIAVLMLGVEMIKPCKCTAPVIASIAGTAHGRSDLTKR